jgi:hypothetical protein
MQMIDVDNLMCKLEHPDLGTRGFVGEKPNKNLKKSSGFFQQNQPRCF